MNNYTKMDEEQPLSNECVICFDPVNINDTHIKCCNCEKIFHKSCMDRWRFKKRDICICPSCTKNDLLLHRYFFTYDICCLRIKRKNPIKKIYEYN